MTESEMKSAVQSFRTVEYQALKGKMEFMLDTHASDHVTPTHVNLGADRPKSFYMKRGSVQEVQGTKLGKIGWGPQMGEVKNIVMVPGVVPITKEDEAQILYQVLRNATDFMVISKDDSVGKKCLLITAIPKAYAGFSYLTKREAGVGASGASAALPVEVYYNVVCIRAGLNTKLLSTYPASQSYIDAQGAGFIG
jgi:hypothetical protein